MNKPCVKQYDAQTGALKNPIKGFYPSRIAWRNEDGSIGVMPNRSERRAQIRGKRQKQNIGQFIDRGHASKAVIPTTKRGKNGKFTVANR